jgi:hypothetical protein
MASITSAGITFTTVAGNKTVVATPAAADLIVIICANTGRTTAQAPAVTDNNSDGFGTTPGYTNCTALASTKATSADSMWVFVRNALIGSGTSTTFTFAPAGGADSGGGLQVFRVSGMSIVGQGAIRGGGIQSNQAAAGTPTPVLLARLGTSYVGTQAALTANCGIGAVFNATNPATMTAPASWTESQDVGYATPTTGLETAFRNSGITISSIAWGGTSGSAFCSVAIELDISVPLLGFVNPAGEAGHPGQVPSMGGRNMIQQGSVGRKATW